MNYTSEKNIVRLVKLTNSKYTRSACNEQINL